jgi:hypothetical protein
MNKFFRAKVLANIYLLLIISMGVVVSSILTGLDRGDWSWFGRSGSIVTVIGVLLTARPLIRLGFDEWFRSESVISGGSFEPSAIEIEEGRQNGLDARASSIGIYMAIIGAIIWGYGDLIKF